MEKYISSTELRQFIAINAMSNGTHDNEFTGTISWLIPKCKELPQTQWQTAEEFASNSVDGWCWIVFAGRTVEMAYYFKDVNEFHDRDDSGYSFACKNITHVMPIQTPGAPK